MLTTSSRLTVVLLVSLTPAFARELKFEDRVAAQEAIERVYYSHQVGATKAFEVAISRAVLEEKVRAYLADSVAAEERWCTAITDEMLHVEAERMRRGSSMPERLREIEAALGNDPVLFEECVARPALAGRLASGGPALAARATGKTAKGIGLPLSDTSSPSVRESICAADDTWDNGSLDDPASPEPGRYAHTAVWTGSVMIVWGGIGSGSTGSRYDPATDTWTPTSTVGAPGPRSYHTAVWTGSEMIVWGGGTATGGRYDPIVDTWRQTSMIGAPQARENHTAVWTGNRMLVWGGSRQQSLYLNTGGRYDPATDTWSATSLADAPSPRDRQTAVWTGDEMLVWGGYANGFPPQGGRYNPSTDSWQPMSLANAASPRIRHTAVWTGDRMVVFGGTGANDSGTLDTGGLYFPWQDAWAPTSNSGAHLRAQHTAVWTGQEMILWGGHDNNTGDRYKPSMDLWTPISTTNAPIGRSDHTAVWTGSVMIVWGGRGSPGVLDTGGRWAFGHMTDDDGDGLTECGGDCNDGNSAAHPGAPEICNRADDDCDGVIDQGDDDSDGYDECQGDCDDLNRLVNPVGAEVCDGLDNDCDGGIDNVPEVCDGLDNDCDGTADDDPLPPSSVRLVFANRTRLEWQPGYGVYDLVKGNVHALRAAGGDFSTTLVGCLEDDSSSTFSIDSTPPPSVGSGYYYLVRAFACALGTYDTQSASQTRSRDPGIAASPAACP